MYLNELLVVEIYQSPVWEDGEEEKVPLWNQRNGEVGKRSCYL